MSDSLCVSTIRCLSADMVDAANSGHPGMPLGMAPAAHVLFSRGHISFDASNPGYLNRDRFVLSNGHGCALLYSMLHLCGYNVTMEDLKKFRQLDSKTPGHPECFDTPGVEVTTGPLGQGIGNAVGIAAAAENLGARFKLASGKPLVDHYTYVFCGDGCLMEGVALEAISLAGHLGLGKLIILYDDNGITIDGSTKLSFTEDVRKRAEACGWHTSVVMNGDEDLDAIHNAIVEAKNVSGKPSLISLKTTIGYASPLAGQHKVHGAPLGKDNTKKLKKTLGFDEEKSFVVPEEVYAAYRKVAEAGKQRAAEWQAEVQRTLDANSDGLQDLRSILNPNWEALTKQVEAALPKWSTNDKPVATRKASERCLECIMPCLPQMVGGSADLTPSNLTFVPGAKDFQKESYDGRYFRFGVREHAMAAFANGVSAYGNNTLIPYVGTFLNFIGYALGSVRLSALSHHHVVYVATHDSIGLGEDGPTHQPIEIVAALRATPNMLMFRPADANETAGSYFQAVMVNQHYPSVLALSRQEVPILEGSSAGKVALGAYVLNTFGGAADAKPTVILAGTGTEVSLCVDAAKALASEGFVVRVVSMPSWELFERQSLEYRGSVFLAGVPVVACEALSTFGWSKYSHAQVGMVTFGASGPFKDVYKKFGITAENVAAKARRVVEVYKTTAPVLVHADL
eukprot:ANDGO_02631.mRNA.1 Transketolase 1